MLAALGGYRAALEHGPYRRLWISAIISRAGDTINFTALPLLVFGITRSVLAVAGTVFAEGIGLIAGGLLAQLIVDRVAPRRLLVAIDLFRAGAAALLAAILTVPTAVAVSFLLGAGSASFSPVSNAIVPRLVPNQALPAANGLQWTAGVLLQLVAAPIGGLLVSAGQARLAFALNAASFITSAALLTGLPRLPSLQQKPGAAWLQLAGTVRAVRSVGILPPLLAMQGLAALAVGATSALLVVLASRAYHLSGTGYGLWLSAIAVGALIGPFLNPILAQLPSRLVIGGAYVIRGCGDAALGLLRNAIGGGVLLGIYGINTSSGMVTFQTMVQRDVPPAVRGRAFALLDVVWQSGRLLSIAAGAALAAAIGVRALFVVGGGLLVGAGLIGIMGLSSPPSSGHNQGDPHAPPSRRTLP